MPIVSTENAGEAPLKVQLFSPPGPQSPPRALPFEQTRVNGSLYRFNFTPTAAGTHTINILYGNFPIPLSPFGLAVQNVQLPDAYGDGLFRARVMQDTDFFLNSGKLVGKLAVEITGVFAY